ncbi:MAG: hypothetical protein ACJA0N_002484 [Pseudohongiellaceae bacterium]|jgi:hypothetical protein
MPPVEHFDIFISHPIGKGRFASANEIVSATLRIFEDNKRKIETLQYLLE